MHAIVFSLLAGVTDPEEKRRHRHEFIRVFEEASKRLGPFNYLAQGTLYPDVIESADTNIDPKSGERVAVKLRAITTSVVCPDLRFKLVEPHANSLKMKFRKVGRSIGLPEEIVQRHPSLDPVGDSHHWEVTAERLDILRDADLLFVRK